MVYFTKPRTDLVGKRNQKTKGSFEMVKIISVDAQEFDVPREVAEKCTFFHACIEDGGDDDIIVYKVKGRELAKILEFCSMLLAEPMPTIPVPLRTSELDTLVGKNYNAFVQSIDVTHELVELILAVDFLGQEELMSLLCAHMAILANTSDNVDDFLSKFDPSYLLTA